MTDRAMLDRLVADAAEAIDVPTDGPARILAEKPPRRRPGTGRRGFDHWGSFAAVAAAIGLVALIAVLAATGGSSHKSASVGGLKASSATTGASARPSGVSGAGASGAVASGQSRAAQAAGSGASASEATSPNQVATVPARVIKTGSIDLTLAGRGRTLGDAMDQIAARADGYGGYVSASDVQAPAAGSSGSGSLTLRVPAADFDQMVAYVRSLGTATTVSTSGQDVTSSYVDMQARITALQDARSQFEQILTRATTIGDILSVESQINDLESQVEQLQGQLHLLDDQTSFSTLTVALSVTAAGGPPVTVHPASGLARAWDRARRDFAHGFEAVLGSLGGIAVFLVVAGAVLLIGRLVWRFAARRLL